MSRGILAFMKGDISLAAQQNLLIVTAFPLSALWFSIRSLKLRQFRNLKNYDKVVIMLSIITVLMFTLARNLPFQYFQFLRPV